MNKPCPFCEILSSDDESRIILENEAGIVIRDGFPVALGHTLIIPKHHIGSFFTITEDVRAGLLVLLDKAKEGIDAKYKPDSYNIGVNDGAAAGQTVPHLHIHLIPRYQGDMDDPRGGVRWIIADKADYWSK
jgi:diadenosine tetraphosphate (Ap4A) HIT family hydrolase